MKKYGKGKLARTHKFRYFNTDQYGNFTLIASLHKEISQKTLNKIFKRKGFE